MVVQVAPLGLSRLIGTVAAAAAQVDTVEQVVVERQGLSQHQNQLLAQVVVGVEVAPI
jgi:hypothetical protein